MSKKTTTALHALSMTNQELFSCAAGVILNQLFDEFPLQSRLDRDSLLAQVFDSSDFQKSQWTAGFEKDQADILKMALEAGHLNEETQKKAQAAISNSGKRSAAKKAADLKVTELANQRQRITDVYYETCEFLKLEGFITESELGYRLSSKGLGALGYEFRDGRISKSGRRPIDVIKKGCSKGASTLLQEGVGLFLGASLQFAP